MSGIEVAGLAVAAFPLAFELLEAVSQTFRAILVDYKDYGLVKTFLLWTLFFQARTVISRVRNHVIAHPEDFGQAWVIKKSYTTSFGMIAVAGAIVAQIAITALSLPHQEETHWTVSASFVISLVTGLLSVYFACIIQVKLGDLHSPVEVREWLVTQRNESKWWESRFNSVMNQLDPEAQKRKQILGRIFEQQHQDIHLQFLLEEFRAKHLPSYNSVLLLVAPVQLLNWSVAWLLIGIGIYYGLMFTLNLGGTNGQNGNLAVLLVYIISAVGALASFVLPSLYKLTETSDWIDTNHAELEELLDRSETRPRGEQRGGFLEVPPQVQAFHLGRGPEPTSHVNGRSRGKQTAAVPATTAGAGSSHRISGAADVGNPQPKSIHTVNHENSKEDVAASPSEEPSTNDDFHRLNHDGQTSKADPSDDSRPVS